MQRVGTTTKGWAVWEGYEVWYYPLVEGRWYVYEGLSDDAEGCVTSTRNVHLYLYNTKGNIGVPIALTLNETLNK